jgi:membrane-associated phospholipid phosphatase
MLKRTPWLLAKACKTSKCTCDLFIIRSLLLTAVCFSVFKPAVHAQKVSFDQRILINIMDKRTEGATRFYKGISNTTQTVATAIPISVLVAGLVTNDKTTIKKGLYLVETAAFTALVTHVMKNSFQRDRPYIKNPDILSTSTSSSYSFPSGHTSTAFATATSVTIAYPKWYVAVPAYAWATSVGYSRIYQGVHYPSDVLAGAVLGAGSAWLMHKANKWLFKKEVKAVPQY